MLHRITIREDVVRKYSVSADSIEEAIEYVTEDDLLSEGEPTVTVLTDPDADDRPAVSHLFPTRNVDAIGEVESYIVIRPDGSYAFIEGAPTGEVTGVLHPSHVVQTCEGQWTAPGIGNFKTMSEALVAEAEKLARPSFLDRHFSDRPPSEP